MRNDFRSAAVLLTVAVRELPADRFDPGADHFREINDLTFVSLVGLSDPPRPEARDAIALCERAGVRVKGDKWHLR
jgi:Ca2+-transporting ATPase